MSRKRALITGATGQDGTYLAEFLVAKDYEVFGVARRTSADLCATIEILRLKNQIGLIHGDIRDSETIERALKISKPDEIYNLASQSHVGISFECPEETQAINYDAAVHLILSALRQNPKVRIYQASSSEMFGAANESPQTEMTSLNPTSPYGESKVRAFLKCQEIRKNDGVFICSGITYNHESPRRPKNFVTRKITHSMAKVKAGQQPYFAVGNIHARRDWGYANDYIKAMWSMMQEDLPEDFIIATGETHSVKDFINASAQALNISLEWSGSKLAEKAKNLADGSIVVSIDEKFYRQTEPTNLVGDISKVTQKLNWKPSVPFAALVEMMAKNDYNSLTINV